MTKKQFENQLKQQAYAAVPDKFSDLMKTIAAEDGRGVSLSDNGDEPHLVPVVPAHSSKTVERWLALAACFVVVLVAVIIATNRDDTQLTKRPIGGNGTTMTAETPRGSSSSSFEQGGNRGLTTTATAANQNGTTTLSASSGTQTANGSKTPLQTGDTKQKGATAVTTQSTSKWWIDFGIDTTKGGNTTKFVPGGATTEKTEAPSAKPTTKRTTAPTKKGVCSHQITYKVPVMVGNGEIPSDLESCVQYGAPKDERTQHGEVEPTEPTASPAGPTTPTKQSGNVFWSDFSVEDPTQEGECTFYIVYEDVQDIASGTYGVFAGVKFTDGWKIMFHSVCEGGTVLYTNMRIITDKGVCVEEQQYDPTTEILTITRRNEQGETLASYTKKIAKGSKAFAYMGVS